MKHLFVFFAIIFFCFPCSGQQKGSLEEVILTVMNDYDAIGASAVVVKDNKICYHQTFGYNPDFNDEALRNPIPEDGVFWIASISKTFISTAIMQLVEKKKLKLDDDVNRFLKYNVRNPNYPDVPITVRMLLCHRSSLNDSQYSWTLKMLESSNRKYAENFNEYKPGEKYSYCNLGYNILGAIIEGVTGMRFDEYISSKICEPLGIEGSFNLTRVDSAKLVRAYMYDKEKTEFYVDSSIYKYQYVRKKLDNYKLGESTAGLSPAGGMRITAMDLAKWMMVHMNYGRYNGRRIIKKKTELSMWEPQGDETKYGFAFSQYNNIVKGENFIGMTGGSHGVNSVMFFNPEKKYGFIVITNGYKPVSSNGRLSSLARELVRPLYNHFIKEQ